MKLKIALLQMLASERNIAENIKTGERYCRHAAQLGAHIAVFPEMFSIGYPTPYNENNSFEIWEKVAFERSPPAKFDELIERYRSYAIEDNHEYVQHFRDLAKELKMAIVVTYMSKGSRYPRNTALLIDHTGRDVLKYSKTHLFAPFVIDSLCEPGGEFFVKELETSAGPLKLGILICADRNIPEPSRVLMKQGAEVVIIPNSCPLKGLGGIILDLVKIRAYENAMAVTICNYPAPKDDGYSAAFNPDGTCVFRAGTEEGLYLVEYDLEEIRRYRATTMFGDAFREEIYFSGILGGEVKEPFAERINAIGQRPCQYYRGKKWEALDEGEDMGSGFSFLPK